MKRVCIYCQTWESGGIEAFISNVLSYMDLSGLQIDIVTDALKKSVFTDRLQALGITFWELSGSPRKLVQNYRLFDRLMAERQYDVIHLNIFQALPLVYLACARRQNIPVRIAHSHNTMLRKSRTRVLKTGIHQAAGRLFSSNATELWACSADAAKFMFPPALLKRKGYRFIPNGIDLQRFRFDKTARKNTRRKLHLEDAFVIGNVGRLCFQKNQSFLLDIFAQIYAQDASARLLLIGEGEALAELKEKAARLSLSDAVIFYGTVSQVENLFWAMDVLVFPSVFEGLGIVAVEAQAAGLPTICSDCVPQEAFVSGCVRQLPLSVPARQWADAVLATKNSRPGVDTISEIAAKGFDISDVSRDIRQVFLQ